MTQTQDKYVVRFPDGLRDRIKATAAQNGRSMNSEIVRALVEKFPEPVVDAHVLLGLLWFLAEATDDAKSELQDDPQKMLVVAGWPFVLSSSGRSVTLTLPDDSDTDDSAE